MLELPSIPEAPFLEADVNGFVSVRGHRIGFHHVVRAYRDGHTLISIGEMYPTLTADEIQQVIAYYEQSPALVDRYIQVHDTQLAELAKQNRGPSLAELQARLTRMRRAGA